MIKESAVIYDYQQTSCSTEDKYIFLLNIFKRYQREKSTSNIFVYQFVNSYGKVGSVILKAITDKNITKKYHFILDKKSDTISKI